MFLYYAWKTSQLDLERKKLQQPVICLRRSLLSHIPFFLVFCRPSYLYLQVLPRLGKRKQVSIDTFTAKRFQSEPLNTDQNKGNVASTQSHYHDIHVPTTTLSTLVADYQFPTNASN